MRSGDVQRKKRRLTEEQEELRLDGLRILARLIARRCLVDQEPDAATEPETGRPESTDGEDVGMQGMDEAA